MLERPESVADLVVPTDDAASMSAIFQGFFTEGNTDPEFGWFGALPLAQVNGEFRSSIITFPANGRLPFTERGAALSDSIGALVVTGFDGPEQRELSERCLSGMASPPMNNLPIELPRSFAQTDDHLVIYSEDAGGLRIISLNGAEPGEAQRRFKGYSRGHWDGDTLVVETTHFRHDYPVPCAVELSSDFAPLQMAS